MERLMKPVFCQSLFTVLAFVCCLQAQTLKQIATIDLPGPKGERFDYLTMDDEDHYLLSAHLGPGILYVIDVGTNKLVKAIPGVPGVTGLEYVPGLRKVYTSDWGEEKIGVVDLRSNESDQTPCNGCQTERERIRRAVSQGVCFEYARESGGDCRCGQG